MFSYTAKTATKKHFSIYISELRLQPSITSFNVSDRPVIPYPIMSYHVTAPEHHYLGDHLVTTKAF